MALIEEEGDIEVDLGEAIGMAHGGQIPPVNGAKMRNLKPQ